MYRRYKIYHFFHKGCETWSLTLSIRTWDQEVCELSPEEDMWVYEGRGKRSLTDIAWRRAWWYVILPKQYWGKLLKKDELGMQQAWQRIEIYRGLKYGNECRAP